jgi:Undecaprenyl-phosphate glucose phosphotransferase
MEKKSHKPRVEPILTVMEKPMKSAAMVGIEGHPDFNVTQVLFSESDCHAPDSEAKISLSHFAAFVMLTDLGFMLTTLMLVRHSLISLLGVQALSGSIALVIFLSAISLGLLFYAKTYHIEIIGNFRFFCVRFLVTLAAVLSACLLRLYVEPSSMAIVEFLRAFASWGWIAICSFLLMRYMVFSAFRYLVKEGWVCHNVVVIGTSAVAEAFISRVHDAGLGVHVNAVFDEHLSAGVSENVAGVPVKGGVLELLRYVKYNLVDTVVVAAAERQTVDDLSALILKLAVQPLRIRVLTPHLTRFARAKDLVFGWCAPAGEVPGEHLMATVNRPIEGSASLMKSAFDFSAALFAIVLFAPIMAICAIGIKLTSPGPVFYRQPRIGYSNRLFEVLKFRTMHVAQCDTGELTMRNDPRVFKFGEILRKFSLDELPQLFNVLMGDMSLVGPRPHMLEAKAAGVLYFDAVPNYAARHRVKPGITGLAQVSGFRGPTETIEQIENRVAYDLLYVENWSLALDLKILFRTVFVGFYGENTF